MRTGGNGVSIFNPLLTLRQWGRESKKKNATHFSSPVVIWWNVFLLSATSYFPSLFGVSMRISRMSTSNGFIHNFSFIKLRNRLWKNVRNEFSWSINTEYFLKSSLIFTHSFVPCLMQNFPALIFLDGASKLLVDVQ